MLRAFHVSLTGAVSRWLINEPTGSITTWDDLKTKFLNKYCPPARTAKKMEEINNFQQEPDENIYQTWDQFKELLMKCPQHYLTEMQETDADAKVAIQEMAEYSKNGTMEHLAPTPGFYQRNNANPSYQERRQSMEDTLSKFMSESIKRHEENFNLIKEIRASTDAAIRNQGASIKTLEIQIRQMSKSISTTIEADSCPIHRIGSSQYAISTGQNCTLRYKTRQTTIPFSSRLNGYYYNEKKGSYGLQFSEAYSEASHINNSIPRKEKDPRSLTLPCFINNVCFDNALVNLGASVSVMTLSTYINLGLGELAHIRLTVELADKTVKYPKGIAENVLVGIGKFVFPVDFIILDMLEDIKVPLILGRPFLSTACAKIDVYKRKIILRVREERIIFKSVKPASSLIKRVYMLSLRERIELNLEARLMGETLVLNRLLDPFFEDYIELNDLNEPYELSRNQGDDLMPTIEEGEAIEEFITRDDELDIRIDDFSSYCDDDKKIHINYMDAYRDEGMGDVIFGEPFLREVGIKTRRFEGMITIYNGNESVTYQMVRSHPRFKHHTNEQCNKIPPLLKDPITFEMRGRKNGSHAGTLACMRWNGEKKLKKSYSPEDILSNYGVLGEDMLKRHAFWSLNEEFEKVYLSDSQYRIILDLYDVQFGRTSLTGFPAQSVRSSNAYALDSLYLLVLNTGTSQSRQHDMSKSDSYYLSN
ncbi:hypothetical protein Tco_0916853 [Tanacetum coccineum]